MEPKKKVGGYRPGAGRKPMDLGERQVDELIKAFKKKGKECDSSPGLELANLAFDSKNERVRLKALDVYFRAVAIRKSHRILETHEFSKPTVYLPEIKERPTREELERAGELH
jgi:hypothetical protein